MYGINFIIPSFTFYTHSIHKSYYASIFPSLKQYLITQNIVKLITLSQNKPSNSFSAQGSVRPTRKTLALIITYSNLLSYTSI